MMKGISSSSVVIVIIDHIPITMPMFRTQLGHHDMNAARKLKLVTSTNSRNSASGGEISSRVNNLQEYEVRPLGLKQSFLSSIYCS